MNTTSSAVPRSSLRALALVAGLLALAWIWLTVPLWQEDDMIARLLLWHGAMPRAVIGLLAGALLGLAGVLMQAVLRNPIADPSSLGLTGGAQLALIVATVFAPDLLAWGRWPLALLGASGALALVMALGAAREFHPVSMVVAGMLVTLLASGIGAALVLSQGQYLFSLLIWSGGSLVQTGWGPSLALAPVLGVGLALAFALVRPLQVIVLGQAVGRGLGQNTARVRAAVLALATVLAAGVSASVGLVGFVGLAAPALARMLGAHGLRAQLALAPACGALILFGTDLAVQYAGDALGEMFPAGATVGLIGGPLLIWLMRRLRAASPPQAPQRMARHPRPMRLLGGLCLAIPLVLVALAGLGRVPGGWAWLAPDQLAAFLPDRLTRLAAAGASGGLLALAGAVMQRLSANPLASPEVLGVSGGAAMGYGLMLFVLAAPDPVTLTLGAGLGGALALGLLLAVIRRGRLQAPRVLLAGLSVSALAGSVLTLMMAMGTSKSFAILAWLSGSSASVGRPAALSLIAALIALSALALAGRRWLALLGLGPQIAGALGVPERGAWALFLLLAALATGAATVLVGPVSFVGLMAPHLARHLGLSQPGPHLAGATLIGVLMMVLADFGARMAAFPYELPLGVFAALIGTPWLIWLMLRRYG